jgi:hypothetical protein
MIKNPLKSMGHHEAKHTPAEKDTLETFCDAFNSSNVPLAQRLQNFPRHVRRQDIARFLAKYEIFQKALPIHGNIIECGVFAGGGISSWISRVSWNLTIIPDESSVSIPLRVSQACMPRTQPQDHQITSINRPSISAKA